MNFPAVTDKVIRENLDKDFDTLVVALKAEITKECDKIRESIHDVWFVPSPFMDLLRAGKKYNNFGIHGSGIATAADALAAVKKFVYDEKKITPDRLIAALDANFENDPELLIYAPKGHTSKVVGQHKKNKNHLLKEYAFSKVKVIECDDVKEYDVFLRIEERK